MNEQKRQEEKEKAVLLALRHGFALIRRGLEVHAFKPDGTTEVVSTSALYDTLWSDALRELRKRFGKSQSSSLRPKVGLGVMVLKDGKVLLGKRKSSHGAGEWAWPGGHLEYMESIVECARREVREETGMEIKNVRFLRLYNLKEYAPKHYADIGMTADWKSGEPQVLELEKCERWEWFDMDNLPSPLFATVPSYIEAYRTGKNFFDA